MDNKKNSNQLAEEYAQQACTASYMTPWATVAAVTALYLLCILWLFKNGKKICVPTPDSIYPYRKKIKHLKRDLSHLLVDDFNIEITDQTLGLGSVGFVFKGYVFPNTRNRYKQKVPAAVKMSFPIPAKSLILLEEASRLAHLNHPNIVQILAVSKLSFTVLRPQIVMEWLSGGSLLEFFRQEIRGRDEDERPTVYLKDIIRILVEIANALNHIHEAVDQFGQQEYVHGDVAARNVLLTTRNLSKCTAKLGDFGVPVEYGPLPIAWMPPEIICSTERNPRLRKEADVWMFGVLFWECLTLGAEPHYQKSIEDIKKSFRLPDRGLPPPMNCPLDVWSLIIECLSESHRRPRFCGPKDANPSLIFKIAQVYESHKNSRERLQPAANVSNCTCSEHRCKNGHANFGSFE